MIKQVISIFLFFIFSNTFVTAQQQEGNVKINQSEAIGRLLLKHIQVNEYHPWVEGYRVQLFSVSGVNSRDKANALKAKFLLRHSKADVYIVYHAPYYKVRLGDFRTKIEALAYLQTISKEYPSGFVVVDRIKFMDTKEDDTADIDNKI